MRLRKYLSGAGRLLLVLVVWIVAQGLAAKITGLDRVVLQSAPAAPDPRTATAAGMMLLYSASVVAVFAMVIGQSRAHGWKLAGAVFLCMFGVGTFVIQIESIVFLTDRLPAGMITALFISGALAAGIFSPVTVWILGRWKAAAIDVVDAGATDQDRGERLVVGAVPINPWLLRLAVLGLLYTVLYFGFGYYVAWQSVAVRDYYQGTDPGSFTEQLLILARNRPGLLQLQMVRGVMFVLCVLPVVGLHRGSRLSRSLQVGLVMAVWPLALLLPNPFMPWEVARVHLLEVFVSNLIFGLVIGWTGWPGRRSKAVERATSHAPVST